MARSVLRKVVGREDVKAMLRELAVHGTLSVEDESGVPIFGSVDSGPSQHVRNGDVVVGEVRGRGAVGVAAKVLTALVAAEAQKRALAAETLQQYRDVHLLQNLSAEIATCVDIGHAAQVAVTQVATHLGARSGAVLLESEVDRFTVAASQGSKWNWKGSMQLEGIALRVWESGQAEMLGDVLSAPLIAMSDGEKVTVGVVVLSAERGSSWSAGHLRLVASAASQLGTVIDNARLYEQRLQDAEHRARLGAARDEAIAHSRAKSAFLANMSHELRTPLNAILGYADLIREEAEPTASGHMLEDLEKICIAGRHLHSLISNILDLAKIESGRVAVNPENADVQLLCYDVVATIGPLARANGNQLDLHCPHQPGPVWADVRKLRQSLLNLLGNACKFTRNGVVTLTVERAPGSDTIDFVVTDSGIGMTDDECVRVFDEFSQASASTRDTYGGTGLGLAICRKLCRLMGGDITLKSEVGKGSVFTIRLPLCEPQRVDNLTPAPTAEPSALVIARPATSRALRPVLSGAGLTSREIADGARAIRAGTDAHPALILLEVRPGDVDPWGILRAIRRNGGLARVPVIPFALGEAGSHAIHLGAAYLSKPMDRGAFVRQIAPIPRSGPVLLVDGDAKTRAITARVLVTEGFDVIEATSESPALRLLEEHRFSLVVVDLLRAGAEGLALFAAMVDQRVPCVVLTDLDMPPRLDREREAAAQIVHARGADLGAFSKQLRLTLVDLGFPAPPSTPR